MSIRLIGQVAVGDEDGPQYVSAPKLACVLAVLASTPGTPVHHFDLISSTWGTDPPKSVIAVLYSYITRLRSILRHVPGALLRSDRQHYVLEIDPERVDIHRVRALAARARELRSAGRAGEALPLLREAAGCSEQEALIGVSGDWAERFRSAFRQDRSDLLAERYAVELELGHHRAVLPELTRHVSREPTAERLVGHLMLALYRDGRPTEALEAFTTARERLRDRLGVDPSPQLRRLQVQILNQAPELEMAGADTVIEDDTAPAPAPAQLPAATRGFTGREADISAVTARATDGGVVVIDGMAGVGKTALAVHTAHLLADEYPDGQLFLDLRGYAEGVPPMSTAAALAYLLRSLNVAVPDDPAERPAAWRTALSGRRVLLVLDNARDADQVLPLLPGESRCLTLVTARRRFVHLVDALPVSLDVMSPEMAAEMFTSDTGITAGSPVAREIAEACGYLPLALRIAASRLRNRPTWTPQLLLERLREGHGPIRELDGAGRGIQTAFSLSYHELDESAKWMFRVLSVFSGADVDRYQAAALAAIEDEQAELLLEQLVDSHLLVSTRPGRYQMHDLLRQYAAAILSPEDHRAAWIRLAELYIFAAWHTAALVSPLPVNWPRQLDVPDASIPLPRNIDEAETWMSEELPVLEHLIIDADKYGLDAHGVDLCMPVQAYLMSQGAASARLPLAELGVAAAHRLGSESAEARMENYLGLAYQVLGEYDFAETHLRRASVLWRGLDDAIGQVMALNNLAVVADHRGNVRDVLALTAEAISVARRAQSPTHLAILLFNQASSLTELRRYDEAAAHLDECDAILVDLDNIRLSAWASSRRGLLLAATGEPEEALACHRKALEYAGHDGTTDVTQAALWGMAEAYLGMGEPDKAMPYIDRQLELLEHLNLPSNRAETLGQLGHAHMQFGRFHEAAETLMGAVEIARGIGAHRYMAKVQRLLGEALLAVGDTGGRAHLKVAMDLYGASGYPEADDIRRMLQT